MQSIRATVETDGDVEEELRSLLRWLRADEETGPYTYGELASSVAPDPEHMGAPPLDLISLTVSVALGAGQLAVGIAQWRGARPGAPKVTLHRGDVRVEVHDADPDTVLRLTEMLAEGRDDGSAGAS
ncbi:hypothetical protein AB0Q95_43865 [Streptomyces sp. NPDC059900]|uniref:effector-associated constant component EACC1 n=1 Tax=Streptomyces sp. NPDC059900 TaxID=3155816 RepID=UPI003419D861